MQINMESDTHISRINIGGLSGRMLHVPGPKKKGRKILLIYGLHSSIERMRTTAEFHGQFGEVIMPDLPGFGGMDSFYTIGKEPSLDSYADYLYSFMKVQKLNTEVTIIAMSFGSLIVTRMLQKYPETISYVKDNIAVVGFGRHTDFNTSPLVKRIYIALSRVFATKVGSWLVSTLVFNPISLRLMFAFFRLFNPKYKHTLGEERKASVRMELDLWQKNDTRTKFYTYELIMSFDLTRKASPIPMTIYNMYTPTDQYFDGERVADTMGTLYEKHVGSIAQSELHAPSILGSVDEVAAMYSDDIKKLLQKS